VPAESPLVTLRTLGCKVNRSESETLGEQLAALGVLVSPEADGADAVIVNTCTVTGEADAKARKEVRRALGSTAGPVVVTGCLAAVDAEGLRALGERVVVEPDRRVVPGTVVALVQAAPRAVAVRQAHPLARTRALVKVQDGCDNRCAYCIVPDARGVPRSIPAGQVIDRVVELHGAGTAEVVLTGINIGRYDDPGARDLAALIERVAETGVRRIRLSSIEPPDLDDRLLGVLAATAAVAPHLHLPLQSGCDSTLAAMGRRYGTGQFAKTVERARAALPGLAVTTDVMAGFPGETDADFEESLEFAAGCGFTKLHVFRYSKRAGTPAAGRSDQVPEHVKSLRAERLRDLSARLERAHRHARAGSTAMLLMEVTRGSQARGTTEDYLRVPAAFKGAHAGDLVPVVLRASDDGTLRAYHATRGVASL
jgi:threonylcarbamoyladenosine tRNA methylthiotransferase MtaB